MTDLPVPLTPTKISGLYGTDLPDLPLLLTPTEIAVLYGFGARGVHRVYRLIHKGAFGDEATLPGTGRRILVPRERVLARAQARTEAQS